MPVALPVLHRFLITGSTVELFVNILGLVVLFVPFPADVKRTILITVISVTAVWDVVVLGYLHWAPVAAPAPAAAGAPPPAPPVHHMPRGAIKGGLTGTTMMVLFALVALSMLLFQMGQGYWATVLIVGIFLAVSTIQDTISTVTLLRR